MHTSYPKKGKAMTRPGVDGRAEGLHSFQDTSNSLYAGDTSRTREYKKGERPSFKGTKPKYPKDADGNMVGASCDMDDM